MRSSVLARIPGFWQRIIPEPHGSQARGTRLGKERAEISYFDFDLTKTINIMILWTENLISDTVR
jgi:hypothetical protein